jgi:hypothetical protein
MFANLIVQDGIARLKAVTIRGTTDANVSGVVLSTVVSSCGICTCVFGCSAVLLSHVRDGFCPVVFEPDVI